MLLQDLFAQSLLLWPERIAIDVPPAADRPHRVRITYAQLAHDAARLAAHLGRPSDGERTVAILLPRNSHHLYAAQLAVLQAGAAWVCLEPHFPDRHLAHVLRDSGAVAVLTDAAGRARCAGMIAPGRCLEVADILAQPGDAPVPPPDSTPDPRRLAYLIYTSGTTGTPKAVMLEHRGVVNLIQQGVQRFALQPGDRIAQGSSPAYDSSVEETFLALASGATLVQLDDQTARLGPDLTAWLRHERITVLCPPPTLLRAMNCRAVAQELPDLRLCYAGGEAMPQDLNDTWAAALWLENGYGPTECSVTITRTRLQPGQAVTIGTPVAGNLAHVLDADLQLVADGTPGELCIAGVALARGYLGQPALTAEKFPEHARFGRIYRTGDLVARRADGQLTYHGRIDAQVKLRGHRLELEAIEAALRACPGVQAAACRLQGSDGEALLAAHVIPCDPQQPPDFLALAARLRRELPAIMVPARFGLLAALPQTIGGKLDRKALPELLAQPGIEPDLPTDPLQRVIASACRGPLGVTPGLDDDFFALGGDSLRAAQCISALRRDPGTARLTVRDVYELRTVRALAEQARQTLATAPAAATAATGAVLDQTTGAQRPFWFTCAQTLALAIGLLVGSGVLYLLAFGLLPWGFLGLGPVAALLLAPAFALLGTLGYGLAALWLAVLAKELLVGRYQPMRVPAFSPLHLRLWLVERAVRLVPWSLLAGTELQNIALRALGARIGRRVHLHRGVELLRGGWDLLQIDDDATVGQEAALGLCELDRGHLVFGPVSLGARSTLHTRAGMAPHTAVGPDGELGPLAFLSYGQQVPAGERWDGVPASRSGPAARPPAVNRAHDLSPLAHGLWLLLLRFGLGPLLGLPLALLALLALASTGFDPATLVALCNEPWSHPWGVALLLGTIVLAVPLRLLLQALLLRWSPAVPLGSRSRWRPGYAQLWLRTGVVESAGTWLSGTLFWPWWLRLAGMRIEAGCEVSTILEVLPEHVTVGAHSFFADGIYLGVPRLQGGTVTVAATRLGRNTFVGNHAVIEGGQQLPDDLLLGVCTIADQRTMTAGTGWFGLPAFRLPQREVVTMDRRLTHEPGPIRYLNRLIWEAMRFLLPVLPALVALGWLAAVQQLERVHSLGSMAFLLWLSVASLAAAAVPCVVLLALKWLLLGRVRPGQHALWSCWASRWDFLYVCWQRWAAPVLQQLEGTLLLPFYLRAMGCRIGRGVLLGPGFSQVVDPDMLHLGDGSTVDTMFQAHSFEDRVLKTDHVQVRPGATLGRASVVLYGADIGPGVHVAPHSVVMKHEHLPAGEYAGAPTRPAAAPRLPHAAPPATDAPPPGDLGQRLPALDAARGLAVLGMVYVHLVPSTGAGLAAAPAWLAQVLEGKPAALFCLLAGMAWAIQAQRTTAAGRIWPSLLRRALALALLGIPFGLLVWPTEVLSPLAVMLLCLLPLLRRGPAPLLRLLGAVLLLTPLAAVWFGDLVAEDWREDGTPRVWSAFGWVTLRYYLFDGNYPLLPWLALPLLGAAMVHAGCLRRERLWAWGGLALAAMLPLQVACLALGAAPEHASELGALLQPQLAFTWVPTSLPFLLLAGSAAVAVVASLLHCQIGNGVPRWLRPVALLGRMSLTHYLLHIAVLFPLLRLRWPGEDWPMTVGLMAFAGYVGLALPMTWLWFRFWRRGPAEALLGAASGRGG